jgi:hypothetical protein
MHNHIDRVGNGVAYDDDIADNSIAVHDCGEGVSILWSWRGVSYWQQHGEDCAYSSEELVYMSPKAQLQIREFVWRWYRRAVRAHPRNRTVGTMLQEITNAE